MRPMSSSDAMERPGDSVHVELLGCDTGLPVGVQIIGSYLEDRTTIAFASLLEREFGGFQPPPAFA